MCLRRSFSNAHIPRFEHKQISQQSLFRMDSVYLCIDSIMDTDKTNTVESDVGCPDAVARFGKVTETEKDVEYTQNNTISYDVGFYFLYGLLRRVVLFM